MEDLSFRASRLRNVTATEIATLLGLNQYETPAKLLDKKLNPVTLVSNHLRRGKLKEPSVIEAFKLDLNWRVHPHEGGTIELPEFRIAATPDAYVTGTKNVVECKSVTTRNFEKWYKAIPTNYHMQVHMQMLVTDAEEGFIGALEEGDPYECEYRFAAWKVTRSEILEDLIKKEAARFWKSVEDGTAYRVNSANKKIAIEELSYSSSLIYPTSIPKSKELSHEEELANIVSLFE